MALLKAKKGKSSDKADSEKIGSEESFSDDDIISEDANKQSKKKNKKEKKPKKEKKEKKKDGKGVARFIPIFIFLLVVGGLVAAVRFNVFGVRDRYVMSLLAKIPIVNNLLPQTSATDSGNEYSSLSNDELVTQIQKLNEELATAQDNLEALQRRNDTYVSQLQELQEIEEQQLQIKAEKDEFDRMITQNDPAAYTKFYESIAPENAAALYQEAVATTQQSKELKDYVATFRNMSETDAAKVLEEMISTRMNLVVLILNNMDSATRGAVLGAMDAKNAASVATQMAPTGQQ